MACLHFETPEGRRITTLEISLLYEDGGDGTATLRDPVPWQALAIAFGWRPPKWVAEILR